jgi:hypothetical protein
VALMNEGGFDLVTASGDASLRLIAGKRVQEVNTDLVPSWKTVDERLQSAPWHTVDGKHYGVPYQWGSNVLMYNTKVFPEAPKSWDVVFKETTLPDGKSNKGRVQAFDGPIYIADAALYLKKHRPELKIEDPYSLDEEQYKAALELLRGQRKIVGRYWHDAFVQIDDFTNEGVVASSSWPFHGRLLLLAVPGQYPEEQGRAGRLHHSRGGRYRLGRHHHDACRRPASELRLHVVGAFDQSEAAGRPRRLVRLGAGGALGLQGKPAPHRRRLRGERAREFRADLVLAHARGRLRRRAAVRALLPLGQRLHRRSRRTLTKEAGPTGERGGIAPLLAFQGPEEQTARS